TRRRPGARGCRPGSARRWRRPPRRPTRQGRRLRIQRAGCWRDGPYSLNKPFPREVAPCRLPCGLNRAFPHVHVPSVTWNAKLPRVSSRRRRGLLKHPRAVLAAAAMVLLALGILGSGVDSRLSPTSLDISGTESSRANGILREHFGETAPFAILLRGPAAAVDRQGPRLVR